jgi:hypothetical protein
LHIEFLVEEPSAEKVLSYLVPRMISPDMTMAIHPHQGKQHLLRTLPGRLRSYASWLPPDWRIVVLIDADNQDCRKLKQQLESAAGMNGLITKSAVSTGTPFHVINRLAIEELEAWFFGDIQAVHTAYPRLPSSLSKRARYRNPDNIIGGTWEALERELKRSGYFPTGLPKIAVAGDIAPYMDPARNTSHSFQLFRQGLLDLVNQ